MHLKLLSCTNELFADLMMTRDKAIKITYANVLWQSGGSDCGLLVLAFATSICEGHDPATILTDMRPPLSCIVAGKTTTFPQRSSRRRARVNKTKTELIPVFCKCRLPDDGGVMIPCSQVPQVMYQTTRQVHEQSTLPVLCQCKC